MRKSKDTSVQPETQWAGRLITLCCQHGFTDPVRLGQAGMWLEEEFNRICQDRKVRAWLPGETPGDLGVWLLEGAPPPEEEMDRALKLAHYAASRALFIVAQSSYASLEWWAEMLAALFDIVEIEDNGHHAIILARPLALVGEITVKGAVSHEDRRHQMALNCKFWRRRMSPKNFTGRTMVPHGRRAILACAGPSLRATWPSIKMAKVQYGDEVVVVSCSMAYRYLMDRKLKPDVHIECDPRPHKVAQVLPIEPGTDFWLASCVHPDWQEHVPDALLWHAHNNVESVEAVNEIDPGHGLICGGGSVGIRSISCLYFSGFRRVDIYGMDCSFDPDGEQHAGEHLGKVMPEIEIVCGKRKFRTSPVMVAYARYFATLCEMLPDMEINLAGDGLLQAMHGKR